VNAQREFRLTAGGDEFCFKVSNLDQKTGLVPMQTPPMPMNSNQGRAGNGHADIAHLEKQMMSRTSHENYRKRRMIQFTSHGGLPKNEHIFEGPKDTSSQTR